MTTSTPAQQTPAVDPAASVAARIVHLNDGRDMPQVGYGVFQVDENVTADVVEAALGAGYRSIDTASIYRNETGVGEGLRRGGLARDEMFITTKLWNDRHLDARAALGESLEKLGLDHVDLYLMHWPAPATGDFRAAWKAMIELRDAGLATSIGVCNFEPEHLQTIIDDTGVVPVLNQVELNPSFQQRDLRDFHVRHDILTEAWAPIGQGGPLLEDEVLVDIAAAVARTPAQVVLRWHLQVGNIVIPKSVTPSRIAENLSLEGFQLDAEQMLRIGNLDSPDGRRGPDPVTATF